MRAIKEKKRERRDPLKARKLDNRLYSSGFTVRKDERNVLINIY